MLSTPTRTPRRRGLRAFAASVIGTTAIAGSLAFVPAIAEADIVTAVYEGPSFNPATSPDCGEGFSVLKFTGGTTFDTGAHTDKSSGDVTKIATWTITGDVLSVTGVTYTPTGGTATPMAVNKVIISDNGSGEAYSWSYDPAETPTVADPLLHTVTTAMTQISPLTGNQYLFICAANPAESATLTLNKSVVGGGSALATDWTLSAVGTSASLVGPTGSTLLVPAGTYSLSESGTPANYEMTGLACVNSTNSPVAVTDGNVTLTAGSTVTCTFTNTFVSAPSFTVDKSAPTVTDNAPAGASAGDVLTYKLTLTNTGNVALTGANISDPSLSSLSCTVDGAAALQPLTLAVGKALVCNGSNTLDQSEVDSGLIRNVGTFCASNTTPLCQDDTNDHPVTRSASTSTDKKLVGTVDADQDGMTEVGDVVSYEIVTTNTGNVTLTDVVVTDAVAGVEVEPMANCTWPTATTGTLLPGESVTCDASYTLTQPNIDAGTFTNTASGCGTAPTGVTAPTCGNDSVVVNPPRIPAIDTTKSHTITAAGVAGPLGDVINYTITAKNTGNVTLTNVDVTDNLAGLSALNCTVGVTTVTPPTTLAPGQELVCTATYTISQADIDAGGVTNVANACGTGTATDVVKCDEATDPETFVRTPALEVTKKADLAAVAVDDIITFTIDATNTGNVTLIDVAVTDPKLSNLSCAPAVPNSIIPGASVHCTGTYTVTQADVDAGTVINVAEGCGTAPAGTDPATVCDKGDVTVTAPRTPAIDITKTIVSVGDKTAPISADEVVTFSITATNIGNVTLDGVVITDTLAGATVSCTWPDPSKVGHLNVGDTVTCTATYTLTQADVDSGSITNNAKACGDVLDGNDLDTTLDYTLVCDTDSVKLDILAVPKSSTDKSAAPLVDVDGNGPDAGDTIEYTVVVTNEGNVTTALTAADPLLANLACIPASGSQIAPKGSITCTGTYALTQTDVDAGFVTNTATGCAAGTVCTTDTTTTNIARTAKTATTKTHTSVSDSDGDGSAFSEANDVVTYEITTTNTGNVTLTDVKVTDTVGGVSVEPMADCEWPAGNSVGTLLPGESVTCSATYTLTQGDINTGTFTNVASGCGAAPTGVADPTCAEGDDSVSLPAAPALEATKSHTVVDAGRTGALDDVVTYEITAENTGNVTLAPVSVTDDLIGLGAVTCTLGGAAVAAPYSLQPGEVLTCSATLTITQAHIDNGGVENVASVCGTPPTGTLPCQNPADDVVLDRTPAITVTKTASTLTAALGNVITYTVSAQNSGNVTLTNVTLSDPLLGTLTCPAAPITLAPGQTVECTGTYTVQQADVDNGTLPNTAKACGDAPTGATPAQPCDADTVVVTLPRMPKIGVVKSITNLDLLNADGVIKAGETVTYLVTVTNTGNVTLDGVVPTDSLVPPGTMSCLWPAAEGHLAPTASAECTVSYMLTQGNVDSGSLRNTASACGQVNDGSDAETEPDFTDICGSGFVDLTIAPKPNSTTEKTAGAITDVDGNGHDSGDTIAYSITVTNTGNVTAALTASDPLLGTLACTPVQGTLVAVGGWMICTATYELTQSDVDSGVRNNTATGCAAAGGVRTCTDGSTSNPITRNPALSITKTAVTTDIEMGATATFSITVTNTGNVTLTNVTVSDPIAPLCNKVIAAMAPGATSTYTCSLANVTKDLTNVATVNGSGPNGNNPPADDDDAFVNVTPKVTVLKSANPTTMVLTGNTGTSTFTFRVTNASQESVSNVTLTDNVFGDIGALNRTGVTGTEAAGRISWTISSDVCTVPATLAAGATYSCTVVVTFVVDTSVTPLPSHSNMATAAGTDDEGTTGTGTDGEVVTVGWRGRTPGYWKTHTSAGAWPAPYTKDTLIQNVFTIPTCLKNTKGNLDLGTKSKTGAADNLLAGLGYQGTSTLSGGAEILLRAAISALLNESSVFGASYPGATSTTELIAQVNAALATCDRAKYITLATTLDYWNNGIH